MTGHEGTFVEFEAPRRLTTYEREVVQRLLEHEFPGRAELTAQLELARVTGECQCGCASRTMTAEGAAAAPVERRVPVEGEAVAADGGRIAVLLHVPGGRLAELEIYRLDGDAVKVPPDPATLSAWSPDSRG